MLQDRKRVLAIALVVSGWVLPTVWPGYGVIVGYDAPRDPDWYYSIGYLVEAGYFSRALVFEDTWEGGHGHTGPYFPWRAGQALPLVFVASVVLLAIMPRLSKYIAVLWSLLGCGLAGWGIATHFRPRAVILSTVVVLFLTGAWLYARRRWQREDTDAARWVAIFALGFYPVWIVALGASMRVPPFLGAVAYLSSLGLLLLSENAEQCAR